ncbi:MAG: M23 family metallopeptidase [Alphaproteobacteria bacterium]
MSFLVAPAANASWIMRLINTPPELLGAFLGIGNEVEPQTKSSVPLETLRFSDPSTGQTNNSKVAIPFQDMERSTIADYHAWSYTRPDASLVSKSATENIRRVVKIGKGQNFNTLFRKLGLSKADQVEALKAIKSRYNTSRLQAGTKFDVMLNARVLPGEDGRLKSFSSKPDNLTTLRLEIDKNGKFQSFTKEKKLRKKWVYASADVVRGSVWEDGKNANIPKRIIANLVRAYRHSMDLDRSLRKGDNFKVLFEATLDPDNNIIKSGELLYTSVVLRGKEQSLYWFEDKKRAGFYYPSGRSQKRGANLFQRPVKGRVTSKFGMRYHPVLKRRKMHKGTDYGAARGTPIYAASSGKVVYRGRKGAYGNFIEIRHNSTYSTAYAHLSKFRRKVKKGTYVKKGQLIGYVGSTGRSTGPHLHFELRKNGRQINWQTAKVTQSLDLTGKTREKYFAQRTKTRKIRSGAISNKVAKLQ